jgi:hypothetical protein
MSLPGKKAPAGAAGIRRWLSTVVVCAVALVLALVVISLSVGSPLPATSLHEYITAPLLGEELHGDQEPLAEPERRAQNGTLNSSEASMNSREADDIVPDPVADDNKVPDPVSTDDITPKLDDGTIPGAPELSSDSQRPDQGELLVNYYVVQVLHNTIQT